MPIIPERYSNLDDVREMLPTLILHSKLYDIKNLQPPGFPFLIFANNKHQPATNYIQIGEHLDEILNGNFDEMYDQRFDKLFDEIFNQSFRHGELPVKFRRSVSTSCSTKCL